MSETKAPDPTGKSPDRRKLIAVVHADMIGYSRLIGLDDVGTLDRLRSLRKNLIDPAIEEHGGAGFTYSPRREAGDVKHAREIISRRPGKKQHKELADLGDEDKRW